MEPKVIVITGPTCSGKSFLGLLLAEKLKTEIISADSRQIYKYLDIGTAKPSDAELKKIKHHFINDLEPDEKYNVSRYENEALKIIGNLISNNKVPVVVGGSGLYIKAIVDGIFDTVDVDESFREEMLGKKRIYGNEYLFSELKKVDPVSASKILPQNWKRIIRALEVYHLTGKPIDIHQKEHIRKVNFNFVQFGLNWDRKILYQNIERRVDEMIAGGLVNETKNIIRSYDKNLNSLNTVGYKEIISYLEGSISLNQAIELIKRNTRRFAKRQLTWFRTDDRIVWLEIESQKDLITIADEIIRREDFNERKN